MGSGGRELDEMVRIRRFMELDKSKLPADGGPGFNRLIFANSPYLLQHADNPVDWYEWGEAAFARARAEDKPIFLSIGYATCHWCHVMEHESFEDSAVGEALNRHFVAIKVDREERPDIDSQYMAVAQMMTGSGGWPLQIFMTPERKPFYAATYLPRQSRMGIPGIITVLEKLAGLWRSERSMLEQHTEKVLDALAGMKTPALAALPGEEVLLAAGQQLEQMFDPIYGGFGEAPKFPMPLYLTFLLRYWRRNGKEAVLRMAEQTLTMMRQGGIYDQLGFGFHRYATDRQWQAPHFEKMLYDQAQLAVAYLEMCQITAEGQYCTVAEEILSYVLRELTAPDGGFCSGQDADTEGVEGKYYVWTLDEVNRLLGGETAPVFCRLFDVTAAGNFEGENILHRREPLTQFAGREGVTPELLQAQLERAIVVLLAAREKRIRPFRDEKVLTAWNGLMIGALAKGYAVTGEKRYLAAAEGCATFIKERLHDKSGRLMRSYHLGGAVIPAFLDDYAFFVEGLIELYEVTLTKAHLEDALTLTREMLRLFQDPDAGGFFDTGADAEQLLIKEKGCHDGVIPSGNGVAALNLLRLASISGDDALRREGERVIQAFMGGVVQQPAAYLQLLTAYDFYLGPVTELTLVGSHDAEEVRRMLQAVKKRFIPQLVIRHAQEGDTFKMLAGKPTAYLCAKGSCRPPVTKVAELERLLDEVLR